MFSVPLEHAIGMARAAEEQADQMLLSCTSCLGQTARHKPSAQHRH